MIQDVLLIEDNPGDARLLKEMLREYGTDGIKLTWVAFMGEAETYLAAHQVDVILLDLGLTDAQGLAAVRRAHIAAPQVALLVLTGLDDESMAVQALQEGAEDYLIKGEIEGRGLMRALRYAVERKLMEDALIVTKERAMITLNCIGDAVACTDMDGMITFLNAAAQTMTGWLDHEAAGLPMAEVFRIVDASTGAPVSAPDYPNAAASIYLPPDAVVIRRDGRQIPVEDSNAPIHDRSGLQTGSVFVLRDATRTRAMTAHIVHAAQHDFLTGLPNRLLLNDRITQAIAFALRHEIPLAVLFLDLDGFKHINDSLGHAVGDKLLQSVAQRLVSSVRGSDTVSRQGGDEFVILLYEMKDAEGAVISATRLLAAVARPHSIAGHDLHVTASIGVSIYPDDGQDAETLIRNADTAMYQAKENGRQSFQYFKPAMNMRAVERQSIEESLRRALERREFALHYQPKVDLSTGKISGAEALIRWTHPARGLITPAHFIPVAEDSGLILGIGAWVLREACTEAQAWADAGLPPARMAVNVSAMEFQDENFLPRLFEILAETRLDPSRLELELTETVLMKDAETAISTLAALRDRGVKVAIDDFGTGFSSLSYLRRFPIDVLKIDQSFVSQISNGGGDTAIVAAVIGMARSLKLRVVAEGVETLEELQFLRAQHCDEVQGYYFSRPVLPEAFGELLRAGIFPPPAAAKHQPPSANGHLPASPRQRRRPPPKQESSLPDSREAAESRLRGND
jgi:diguanylate cyclase (GGDEF)-like protein/PAS domain S-box-containing protein